MEKTPDKTREIIFPDMFYVGINVSCLIGIVKTYFGHFYYYFLILCFAYFRPVVIYII
jgi:hypothetical protein